MIAEAKRDVDRLQEENRQLRASLTEARDRAALLADRLQEENRQLRAELADAKGAAAGAREDAERFRAEVDALRVNACGHDIEREQACDLTASELGRVLLWAASVAIERDELRAELGPRGRS